ncbi:MAG: T9SS type A sorting domain-containing protein [bacterium]|nr:T9SS type A sorting domain-containing protein [bacterium]
MHRGDTIVVSSQGITDISHTHSRTILYGNLPNPFNRYTTISYQLPCDQNVTLVIYDVTGKLIRILSDNFETNGLHNIRWDGQNSDGIESPPGIYFSVLNGGSSSQTHKMLKIK